MNGELSLKIFLEVSLSKLKTLSGSGSWMCGWVGVGMQTQSQEVTWALKSIHSIGRPLAVDVLGLWKADKSDTWPLQLNNCKVTRENQEGEAKSALPKWDTYYRHSECGRSIKGLGLQEGARAGGG